MKAFLALLLSATVCCGETITFTNASGEVIAGGKIISADQKTILLQTPDGLVEIAQSEAPPFLREQAKRQLDASKAGALSEEKFAEVLKRVQLSAKASARELQAKLNGIEKLARARVEIAELEQKLAVAKLEVAEALGRLTSTDAKDQISRLEEKFVKTAQERERAVLAKKNELSHALLQQIAQRESTVERQLNELRPRIREAAGAPLISPHARQ